MNEIRPHHGWEGLNNGGEVYGNTSSNSFQDKKIEYLELVKLALKTSMQNTPDSYEKSKEILRLAEEKYAEILDEDLEEKNYIEGDGHEISELLEGIVTDEELQDSNYRIK